MARIQFTVIIALTLGVFELTSLESEQDPNARPWAHHCRESPDRYSTHINQKHASASAVQHNTASQSSRKVSTLYGTVALASTRLPHPISGPASFKGMSQVYTKHTEHRSIQNRILPERCGTNLYKVQSKAKPLSPNEEAFPDRPTTFGQPHTLTLYQRAPRCEHFAKPFAFVFVGMLADGSVSLRW